MPVLTYYYNGTILTMNAKAAQSPHMLVSAGKVVHCDESEAPLGLDFRAADFAEVRQRRASDVTFVDLKGNTVIPGICDAHAHFLMWANGLIHADLMYCKSEAECVDVVKKHYAGAEKGEWLKGRGWAHNLWDVTDLPSKESLDAAFPDNPVVLSSKCGHLSWVNSAALKAAGVDDSVQDPFGGEFERKDGRLTGILKELAMDVVHEKIGEPSLKQRYEALEKAQAYAHSLGITAMQTPEDMDAWDFIQKAHGEGLLSMRVDFWIPVSVLDDLEALRVRHGLGDDRLRISAVKVFADGSLGGRTAQMYDDYENEPGNKGIIVTDEATMVANTLQANRIGLSMAIHAIGDEAVGAVLTAYERAAEEFGTEGDTRTNPVLRNRIEHVQVFAEKDLPRLKKLKPICSIQPIHLCADMKPADAFWGKRARYAYACRTLLDAGCLMPFGSDVPVEPNNPFLGIYAAITRKSLTGQPDSGWYPEECITLQEALEGYTIHCAIASGQQDKLGSLEAGKYADFVVLPANPFEISPEEIRDLKPLATYSENVCVYSTGEWENVIG